MQNISFRGIIKINAPHHIAEKVVDMARTEKLPANQKAKKILGNCDDAHVYSADEKAETYIFTGRDAQKYWQSHCEAWDIMERANNYYGLDDLTDIETNAAWAAHAKNIRNMINSAPYKIPELNVQYFESSYETKINSIDVTV